MKNWLLRNQKIIFWSLLALTLSCGIWLRNIGLDWGDLDFSQRRAVTFHPDEPKFMLIAQEFLKDDFSFKVYYKRSLDYLKTTGAKIAAVARIIHYFFDTFSLKNLYIIGRTISMIYGFLTLLVIYGIGRIFFRNHWTALFALFFLTFSALHSEHSHYATGDISSLFWTFFCIFICLLNRRLARPWHIPIIAFSVGMTLAIKFSFIPLISMLYILFRSKNQFTNLFTAILIVIGTFYLANGFYYTHQDFKSFFNMAFSDNISMREHSKWMNPFVYLFEIACSVGLITFLFFLASFFRKTKLLKTFQNVGWDKVFIIYIPFSIYFLAICFLDVPFARHLLPLIPIVCLASASSAGRLAHYLWTHNKVKALAAILMVIFAYQFTYNFSIQRYFDRDPRYRAQRWIDKKIPKGTPIAASNYTHISAGHKVFPNIDNHMQQAEYVVLHESYYYRYMRSELNPLGAPEKVEEVYRGSEKNLEQINALFNNELPYKLVKKYTVKAITPELWAYKQILGTFPLFLGDVLIYKRLPEGESHKYEETDRG